MNIKASRRQFFKATGVSAAAAGAASVKALDPFAPAEPGLTARWFDKGAQHVLPAWAFTIPIGPPPPTPRPTIQSTWNRLSGGASFSGDPDAFRDGKPVGKVLHGTAAEWNGKLIGGNMAFRNGSWAPATSAWAAMRERVAPDGGSFTWLNNDTGNWAKFGTQNPDGTESLVRCYKIVLQEKLVQLRPDARFPALLYTYDGHIPGPTFRFRHGMPAVVRFQNNLQTEVSIHHHGGHNPTHGDGFPSYYALQGEARDYLYPNILPLRYDEQRKTTEIDFGEGQSTTWYHDHGLDATAFNVSHGLAGFALWFDELELSLIRRGILPGLGNVSAIDPGIPADGDLAAAWAAHAAAHKQRTGKESTLAAAFRNTPDNPNEPYYPEARTPYFNPYDLPIVLQDRVIDRDSGQIVYDSDGHNGYIGDTQLINGKPWPVVTVHSRKYRLRLLDGSNARIYRLRFLDSGTFRLIRNAAGGLEPENIPDATLEARAMEFLRIGKDSWLWPMGQKRKDILLNMANRADLIVDFKAWYAAAQRAGRLTPEGNAEYYLVNTMPQFDGRGPKTKLAEDAGDPNVFSLPFTLNAANPVVAGMVNAGVIPAAFLAAGPQGQPTELNQPIGLVKFVITPDEGEGPDATIDETTILRPRHRIEDDEVMAVREFVFERGKGAWMINGRFYDPTISNASPVSGIKGQKFKVPGGRAGPQQEKESLTYAEEWILRNGGGGWWHPIHIHLEGHQLVGYEKDFEADEVVGPDGVLGIAGQATMRGLPAWADMVGKFGLDPLLPNPHVKTIRDVLTNPSLTPQTGQAEHFTAAYKAANPLLAVLLKPRPGGGPSDAVPALLPALREGPAIQAALAALPGALRGQVNAILDALNDLRLQWAGEMVGNHDTQALGPNTVARIRMRFRTFSGPVVFHCHNVEHEDMRMMVNFEGTLSGKVSELNSHDPSIAPAARTHGQDVTDLNTNPHAAGELPWNAIDGFPHYAWEEKPVPGTPVDQAGVPLIAPREPKKD